MPLPTPRASENRDEFVSRCMASSTMRDEFPDQSQRAAVCHSQWGDAGAKSLDGVLLDQRIWAEAYRDLMPRMRRLWLEAFLIGAELARWERPSGDLLGQRALQSLVGYRALPFNPDAINAAALNFIDNYSDEWWAQFEDSTQRGLRRSIARARAQGLGAAAVSADIESLFGPERANRIAVTETTRLMGRGAQETYRESGFDQWEWRTTRDPWVCGICSPRNGAKFPMGTDFNPAHPNCRCWPVPAGAAFGHGNEDLTDTMTMWTDSQGRWTRERMRLHDEIAADFLAEATPVDDPVYYMMGGGPASGKSTVIESGAVQFPRNVVQIDPDAIKARLPEYRGMVAAGDARAAAFAHEESSYLAKRISSEATAQSKMVLLDGTGDGTYPKLAGKVAGYRQDGHRVVANYVTLDTDTAVNIQKIRAAKTGREVPEVYLREVHREIGRMLPEAIDNNLFDEIYLWDTNVQGEARLILRQVDGVTEIADQDLWERFLRKREDPVLDALLDETARSQAAAATQQVIAP